MVVRDARDWAGLVTFEPSFRGRETSGGLPRFPCKLLWDRMVILVDGEVALCEADITTITDSRPHSAATGA